MIACAPSLSGRKSLYGEPLDSSADSSNSPLADISGQLVRRRSIGPFTLSETFHAHELVLPKHAHRHVYVTFVIERTFHELYSGGAIICRSGGVRFLPAGEIHANRIQAGLRCLHISIDPAMLDQLHQRP